MSSGGLQDQGSGKEEVGDQGVQHGSLESPCDQT